MMIRLKLQDRKWLRPYWEGVQSILVDHCATLVASSNDVARIEGREAVPDRVILFSFPSLSAVQAFFDDPRYAPWRDLRHAGGHAEIIAFDNAYNGGPLEAVAQKDGSS